MKVHVHGYKGGDTMTKYFYSLEGISCSTSAFVTMSFGDDGGGKPDVSESDIEKKKGDKL